MDMSLNAVLASAFSAVLLINIIFSSVIVFFERRNPASSWAWLLVLNLVPVFGFFVYILFGRDSKREKMFLQKERRDTETYYEYAFNSRDYVEKIAEHKRAAENLEHNDLNGLARLNVMIGGAWITENNGVTVFSDGISKFNALLDDIRRAKDYIHMEYYIVRADNLGRQITKELAKKAAEGVEVRLLYDGMGCAALPKNFFAELEKNGGCAAAFLPRFFVRINYRNHRKLCVIDGKIGYIGGFNIGDEYTGLVKRYGNWRDTHLRVEGDAVTQLQMRFAMDWNFTSTKMEVKLNERYFPSNIKGGGSVKAQIVSSGPDTRWKNVRNGYLKMITEAQRHIYISTPYFVPDDAILEGLKIAALSGKDVRIIIPGNPDHLFVYWASMSYLGELLDAGVRCYQYENGFIHTKVISVDQEVASVGTANMDIRSFSLNFEINSFIFDKEVAKRIESDFMRDLEDSIEITKIWYRNRTPYFRIREAFARLISPLL